MKKVLVTGGAGYIGSVLVRLLLEKGYQVRVIDSLKFGGEALYEVAQHQNFEFVKGDIRNEKDIDKAIEGINYVAHLAAIVGDPACSKFAEEAEEVNNTASKMLFEKAEKAGVERFVFASTCSNYGKMEFSVTYDSESSIFP